MDFFFRSISTLEHAFFSIVNEHIFVNLVSLSKKINLTNFGIWQNSVFWELVSHTLIRIISVIPMSNQLK